MSRGVTKQDVDWVVEQLERLEELFPPGAVHGYNHNRSILVQPIEFLRIKAGPRSELYLRAVETMKKDHVVTAKNIVAECLLGFVEMSKDGLLQIPVEAQARVAAATDLMEQVETLLQDRKVHAAAPVMLAGAALEEFLRSLVDVQGVKPRGKPGIANYAKALREAEAISAQDLKDITAWAGLRNSAAHGDFAAIATENARLMAQGVNFFMQTHAPS